MTPASLAAQVGDRLSITPQRILAGGSGALTATATDRAGRQVVVKAVADRPGAVDGHDLASFRAKQE